MTTPGRPLVLVPGISGTRLCRRADVRLPRPDNRWMCLNPARAKEWTAEMSVVAVRAPETGRVTGLRGADPRIVALDGVRGVCSIVPAFDRLGRATRDALDARFQYKYFGHLVERMRGYRPDVDLQAVPYDFRLVLDPGVRAEVFDRLQRRVECAVRRSDKRAVVVAHSLGGLLLAWFLAAHVETGWAETHLDRVVILNAPFGGAPYAARALAFGEHYLAPCAPAFKEGLRLNSGVLMCLPRDVDGMDAPESLEVRDAL